MRPPVLALHTSRNAYLLMSHKMFGLHEQKKKKDSWYHTRIFLIYSRRNKRLAFGFSSEFGHHPPTRLCFDAR
jgi:hypothetical protein